MPLAAVVPYVVAAASAYSAVSSADNQRKALHAQQDAAKAGQVDIDALNEQTKNIAKQNALDSAALEQQLTPEVPMLRSTANQNLLNSLGPDASYQDQAARLQAQLGQNFNTPVLQAAIDKAGRDLALGGRLGVDQQNLVTRHALANAGSVGGGLGLGRDLTARDLGRTSLDLENARLQTALGAGGQEQNLAQNNSARQLNLITLLQQMSQNQFGRNLQAAQYGQSIQQPIVGLDPGSAANIAIGNQNGASGALANRANIYGQQANNYAQTAGQLFGGLLNYNYNSAPAEPVTQTTYPVGPQYGGT